MSLGHFSYLLSDQTGQRSKVAADRLELLAKTAAKRYIEEGVSLNSSIQKIAEGNDLNANQIQRVCEMANIATHQALWSKTAEKDSVAFPLANARIVIHSTGPIENDADDDSCEDKPPPCPVMADSDYAGPPEKLPVVGPPIASLFGVNPDDVHNGFEEPEKKRIIIMIQKKTAAQKSLKSKVLFKGMELETLEKRAFQQVRQAVFDGYTFRELYKAAAASTLGEVATEYFPKWEERLIAEATGSIRQRLEKTAIGKAPEDLISENLGNVTVVNGAHPVLISLDNVKQKTGEIRNGLRGLLRINDEVEMFNQRLRELT